MDRTIPFDEHAVCDICGEQGATDYMGDCICPKCINRDERVKELSALLMSEIDNFSEYQAGNMSLKTLCNIIAKEVLNFNMTIKGEKK
jgi:hypothetical protein